MTARIVVSGTTSGGSGSRTPSMVWAGVAAFLALALFADVALAQEKKDKEKCLRPTPVRNLESIKSSTLAMKGFWGLSVVDNDCNVLDHGSYGPQIDFYLLPPPSKEEKTGYVYIKTYRDFVTKTWDKIKISRGDGWHSGLSTAAHPVTIDRMDDVPFKGTPDKWNDAHNDDASPETMQQRLGEPWDAYADPDKKLPSTSLMAFWQTAHGEFDFKNGTQTNYLIRFPINTTTPIPFNIGYDKKLKEFRMEFYSNVDALSNKSYRFVFR